MYNSQSSLGALDLKVFIKVYAITKKGPKRFSVRKVLHTTYNSESYSDIHFRRVFF